MEDRHINALHTVGSELSFEDVKALCTRFRLPGHLDAQVAYRSVGITNAPDGMVGIYQNFLEAGMCFPVSPLMLHLLSSYGINIS